MRLAKRTYTIPPDLLERFERRVAPGERSASLSRIIEAWLAEAERAELRQSVSEGCRAMAAEYERIERDWEPAADEVWRELE